MKKGYVTILVLTMAGILLAGSAVYGAPEDSDKRARPRRGFELTDERIERIMDRLAEDDPEKAEELEKLRSEDPEKFKAEIRGYMRERYGRRPREGKGAGERPSGREFGRRPTRPGPGRRPGEHGRPGPGGERGRWGMREKHDEFIKWFKENYPEQAEKMSTMKPELHDRRLSVLLRRYQRIYEASKESPELAEVLKEDLKLKQERFRLLRKIRATQDEDKKKTLTGQLETVVSSRFDLIVKRKQIEYKQLLKKLEKLQAQVKESEAEVGKWQKEDFKTENVKTRVENLLSGEEEFKWE
ncbi:MAG: hypothetical protein ACYSR6_13230 [Planctomycetota bacterium]|jgi:hypothetical protein